MTLAAKRRAIRHLLDERDPADAMAAYFALYAPDHKTRLITYPAETERAIGYIALSQTGMDLFRPFVTLRLPEDDLMVGVELIYDALMPGAAVILNAPDRYAPLMYALFDVHVEENLKLFRLDPARFEPIINVLVTQTTSHNGLPQFIVRQLTRDGDEIAASAGLNWLSPTYGEISVNTSPRYRRQGRGRSVVAAMVAYLLDNGRQPLYVVAENNEASIRLAESVGFVDSGRRDIMIQGMLKPRP